MLSKMMGMEKIIQGQGIEHGKGRDQCKKELGAIRDLKEGPCSMILVNPQDEFER